MRLKKLRLMRVSTHLQNSRLVFRRCFRARFVLFSCPLLIVACIPLAFVHLFHNEKVYLTCSPRRGSIDSAFILPFFIDNAIRTQKVLLRNQMDFSIYAAAVNLLTRAAL